ncbi:unnamed protein product [Oikopleura dioica]|uniref:Uncharacterized protein n=1 Tax=Oikopleura dioica TaxID=34765 RepID=E4WTG5_OIKDI|nr:unnamed protein product [Oikopleura dioica]
MPAVNLVDWLGFGIETFDMWELNYYHQQKSFIFEELMISLRDWFLGIYDFMNKYYIDLVGTLISIFLNNDPIIALSKASFFLLDFFFNWFPSIVLNDFLRVREALAVLIKSLVTGPTFAQEFTEEYWLVYINKIVTFTHKFERELMFMAAVDPIVSFARCVEDSRNENDCVLINFFYEKIPNIVDDYLSFPFRACYHILTYVDEIILPISAISWLGSFAERLYFSIGDIIDFILEIDDIVIELAVQFAQGFGQLLSSILASAV